MVFTKKQKKGGKKKTKKAKKDKSETSSTDSTNLPTPVKRKPDLTAEQVEKLIQERSKTFTITRCLIFFLLSLPLGLIPLIYGLRVSNVEIPPMDPKNKYLWMIVLSPLVTAGSLSYCHCIAFQQTLVQVLHESRKDDIDMDVILEAGGWVLLKNNFFSSMCSLFCISYVMINSIPTLRFAIGGLSGSLFALAYYEQKEEQKK